MMLEFLTYDLKVAVLLAVFYMFYRLMLARETFHRVNRIVLLLTAIASFVLPLCVITMHETVVIEGAVGFGEVSVDMGTAVVEEESVPLWQIVLPTLFIIGMVGTLFYTLCSLFRILRIIRHSEHYPQADGITICVTDHAEMAPFSWMHYIVMNRSDYEAEDAAILTHERGHIRFRHSWDLLLVDTLTALQWFNPAIWMLRSDLRAIHEYEADGVVLSQGINARQYQYLLITKAASIGGYSLANGISHSTLKNRINMMLHKKSNRTSLLKLFALVPIVAVALFANAEKVQDVVYAQPETASEALAESAQPEIAAREGDEKFVVKGLVYDLNVDKLSPIVGAVVQVDGTKRGTVTGKDGRFQIEVSHGETLKFAYVGYESTRLSVGKPMAGEDLKIGLLPEGSNPNQSFDVVEEMPEFPGGSDALMKYLATNVHYPEAAEKAGVQGRVIVTFVVDSDGSISDANILKSVDPSLDQEALRLVNSMPKWTPGKQKGKAVRVKYTIPIAFALQGKEETHEIQLTNDAPIKSLVVVGYNKSEILYIVDGKETPYDQFTSIDPKTIESMEVLKDKTAIEKYGDKAKNGVIIVNLKK